MTGEIGERYAIFYLISQGYFIREYHFRKRYGEIDIVAEIGGEICFIEVKTRKSGTFGLPEEAVTRQKMYRLLKVIRYYGTKLYRSYPWRVDVIAITLNSFDELQDLRHYINVVLS